MKIKFKESEGVVFGYLKPGVLFRPMHYGTPLSETVYMKTEECTDKDGAKANAVDTMLGTHIRIGDTYLVAPVEGTFVEGYEEGTND